MGKLKRILPLDEASYDEMLEAYQNGFLSDEEWGDYMQQIFDKYFQNKKAEIKL